MSLGANEQFEETALGRGLRAIVRSWAHLPFASDASEPTVTTGTPVTLLPLTSEIRPWRDGEIIHGFLVGPDVTLEATEAVKGYIMLGGTIHYADIVLPTGQTQNALDTALKAGPREMGIVVQGLPGAGAHLVDPDVS